MQPFTLLLAGDVMTGRGIDQALPGPGDPTLHEALVHDARRYVELAEAAHGAFARPLEPAAIWGDALAEMDRARPDARIVNLETAVTTSADWCRGKEVLYRMHPAHVGCLTAARVDVACLANNHVLDWGRTGLVETLDSLARAGIRTAGAGRDLAAARRPAIVARPGGGRAIVIAIGSTTSGIPAGWRAAADRPGIDVVDDLSPAAAADVVARIAAVKRPGDVAVASIHWGGNWGHDVAEEFVPFAHRLIDGGADVVHGHSSHHVRPIEVHRGRLILYGCGDLVDDYEGIRGYEAFRPDLGLLFFVTVEPDDGRVRGLRMVPVRMERFRLRRAGAADAAWLAGTLSESSARFGCRVVTSDDGELVLRW
ncbi:MAG: CapA family protein [Planctomycetaceae bacterium]